MNIVIIGSSGQLASELNAVHSNYSEHSFRFVSKEDIDITHAQSIQSTLGDQAYDIMINCAAYTAVDKAESDQEQARLINAHAAGLLANFCKDNQIHLIHISTDFVYDGTKTSPYIESDLTNPLSVYGQTKLEGEQAIQHSGCKYTIIRTSWVYSTFGHNFVKTILRLSRERDQLNIVSDQIGTPTYAADLASAILDYLSVYIYHPNQLFHYSNLGVASWYEFAAEIVNQSQISCQVSPIPTTDYPTPAARPAYSVMDKSYIINQTGMVIPEWKESLRRCIELMKVSQ